MFPNKNISCNYPVCLISGTFSPAPGSHEGLFYWAPSAQRFFQPGYISKCACGRGRCKPTPSSILLPTIGTPERKWSRVARRGVGSGSGFGFPDPWPAAPPVIGDSFPNKIVTAVASHKKKMQNGCWHHGRSLPRVASIVSPPSQTSLSAPFHQILYEWNAHVKMYVQKTLIWPLSQRTRKYSWHLCAYFTGLLGSRWISKMAWKLLDVRKRGAPLRI